MFCSHAFILAGAVLLASVASGAVFGDGAATLTSTERLRNLRLASPEVSANFCLTGLVTAVLATDRFILEDGSGRFPISSRTADLPHVGDVVRAAGTVTNTDARLDIVEFCKHTDVVRLGRSQTVPALDIPLSRLSDPDMDMRNVRIRGTLIAAMRDETDAQWEQLFIKDGSLTALVAFKSSGHPSQTPHQSLVDAQVSVSGVCFRHISGARRHLGPYVEIPAGQDLVVLTPVSGDAYDAPPLETFGVFNSTEISRMSRRSLTGTVIATWHPNGALVQEDDGNPVQVAFAEDIPLPPVNRRIRACGYPGTDLYSIYLDLARWRPESGPVTAPVTESDPEAAELFLDRDLSNSHRKRQKARMLKGRLLTLQGEIAPPSRELHTTGRFQLSCGEGMAPIDCSSCPEATTNLTIGCRIRVTGICRPDVDVSSSTLSLPRFREYVLNVRSPDDIRLLRHPPWWTVRRLSLVVGLLICVIGGLAVRSGLQKRRSRLRVEERTRLAVELHDSLSQELAAMSFEIAAARTTRPSDPRNADRHLDTASRMLDSSRTHLRQCLWDLRSDAIENMDFRQAIFDTVGLVTEGAEIRVRVSIHRSSLDETQAYGILRILRELVSNAVRHGGADTIHVAGVTDNGEALLSVTDDGCGFTPESAPGRAEGHFGLVGIHDRVRMLGGTFAISSVPGRGSRAVLRIPLNRKT